VIAPNTVDPDLVDGTALLGFRVPTIVASPWTRGQAQEPRVDSSVSDHTSILKLIEWRWGLAPLTDRDASPDVQNFARLLDLDRPRPGVPPLPNPVAPPPIACPPAATAAVRPPGAAREEKSAWLGLRDSGLLDGWPICVETRGNDEARSA
jgi:phospholipase C